MTGSPLQKSVLYKATDGLSGTMLRNEVITLTGNRNPVSSVASCHQSLFTQVTPNFLHADVLPSKDPDTQQSPGVLTLCAGRQKRFPPLEKFLSRISSCVSSLGLQTTIWGTVKPISGGNLGKKASQWSSYWECLSHLQSDCEDLCWHGLEDLGREGKSEC